MFKLFYTLLIIEYVVEDQDVSTSVIFESQQECYDAMGDGVLDDLYDVLADKYGKEIIMYCKKTLVASGYREILKPRMRPDGG